jgi:uncharacterized protein (TIGR02001 family)
MKPRIEGNMLKMNKIMAISGAIAAIVGISSVATPAQAQIETSFGTFAPVLTGTSNYLFRGISQTKGTAAIQGALDYTYNINAFTPYLGVFASTTRFPNNNTPAGATTNDIRQYYEVDLYGGVKYETPLKGLLLDVGIISYLYPGNTADQNVGGGPNTYGNPQWNEVYGKFAYDFGLATAVGSVFYAKDFSYGSGKGLYVEGGADVPLPYEFLLSARLGRQTIERNVTFGAPDYTTWNVGLSREMTWPLSFTVAAVYSDTNIKKDANLGFDNVANTANVPMGRDSYNQTQNQFSFSIIKKF